MGPLEILVIVACMGIVASVVISRIVRKQKIKKSGGCGGDCGCCDSCPYCKH